MADVAQQILSNVPVDNSVKALAWDAFNQSRDANELATKLKVLGIPQSVKADLWDAKNGTYNPVPNVGLGGVSRPGNPIPQGDQPGFMQRMSEQALGMAHPFQQANSEITQLISNPGDTLKRTVTQPVIGMRDLAYNLMTSPKETLLKLSGGRQFAGDVQQGNFSGAAGNLAGNLVNAATMAAGNPEARAMMAKPVNAGRAALASGMERAAVPAGKLAGITGALYELKAGNPLYAAMSAAFGKPAVTHSIQDLATLLRPAAQAAKAPAEFGTAAASSFLNSPGIGGDIPVSRMLSLPPAEQDAIRLGPSSITQGEREGVFPAARTVTRDTNTGNLRNQFLTSAASPEQGPSIVDTQGMRNTNTPTQNRFVELMRSAMEAPEGTSMDAQAAVDQRMAEYAKTPWDEWQLRTHLGKPTPVEGMDGLFDYPIMKNGQQIGNARISISGDEARVGAVAPKGYRPGDQPMQLGTADARALRSQFEAEHPGVKLKWNPGSASNERVAARAQRRASVQQHLSVPQVGRFPAASVEVTNNTPTNVVQDLLWRSVPTRK